MTFALGPALLFCPADRPERYGKAAERSDAVILDLEDAVAPGDKAAAREALLAHPLDPSRTIVRVSAAVDPALGDPYMPDDVLQLGWFDEDAGPRWHTPTEVSAAALAVLDDGVGRTLGSVRPWDRRP